MAFPVELRLQRLVPGHAQALLALSTEAGWNQTAADWRWLAEFGEGYGLWQGDRPVASAIGLSYGARFAWISMVLVTRRWRRKGIATDLLRDVCRRLLERGLVPGLDATPAGQVVYRQLGFAEVYGVERMVAERLRFTATAAAARPIEPHELPELASWDAVLFGAQRASILQMLYRRAPYCAYLLRKNGSLRGFVMGRNGRLATHIGPLLASDAEAAQALLQAALSAVRARGRPVLIDALPSQSVWMEVLQKLGFQSRRRFNRMLLGRSEPFDRPDNIFAIAGPELG